MELQLFRSANTLTNKRGAAVKNYAVGAAPDLEAESHAAKTSRESNKRMSMQY